MHAAARNALITRLSAHALLADVPVWWTHAPDDDAVPFIILTVITDQREAAHDGATGLATSMVQAEAWAADQAHAEALRDAILDQLHGWRGTVGATVFGYVLHDASREAFDDAANLSRAAADLRIGYHTAAAPNTLP